MNVARVSAFGLMLALVLSLGANRAMADDAAKTISGKSSCGGCSGVAASCCVMLTDASGARWILRGDDKILKTAFDGRHSGKKMTAKYTVAPTTKKDKSGKEYKEITVTEVKVES
jgi:hypothetical protein